MAEEETLNLSPSEACYTTVEAYKHYLTPLIRETWQAFHYRQYSERIEQWQSCCPSQKSRVTDLRPSDPAIGQSREITLPEGLIRPGCEQLLYLASDPARPSPGKNWHMEENKKWDDLWATAYSELAADLHKCCVYAFQTCLGKATFDGGASQKTSESGAVAICAATYSPEHLLKGTASARLSREAVPPWDKRAPPGWVEEKQCQKEKEQYAKDHQANLVEKAIRERQASLRKLTEERDQCLQEAEQIPKLQAALTVTPGWDALAQGTLGIDAAVCGSAALVMGFLLGMPGRPGKRLWAGILAAVLTLLAYLGLIALLPDTRLPFLAFAAAVAVLLTSLRTLVRAFVLLRRQRSAIIS